MNKIRRLAAMTAFVVMYIFHSPSLSAAEPLLENLKAPTWVESQLNSAREANSRNRNAGNQARNAGRDSIGRGSRNMSNGRHHHMHPQINLGAFQIAQGLLGLMASAQADKLADQDSTIAGKLEAVPDGGPNNSLLSSGVSSVSADDSVSGSSSLGENPGAPAASSKLSQADLANPDTKNALAQIQDQFGYSPSEFVDKLAAGHDPAALFTHAPTNRLTAEEAHAASAASMAAADHDPAVALPTITSVAPTAAAAETAAPVNNSLRESLRDALARRLASKGSTDGDDEVELSPDVKAALAARAAEDAERAKREAAASRTEEYNLFEVVHLKYVEREKAHTIP